MNEQKNVFTALFDALRAINDNILVLSENLAETHRKTEEIQRLLTEAPAPEGTRAANKKTASKE